MITTEGATRILTLAVIVSYNSGSQLLTCVESILAQSLPLRLVVVDNGSTDGSIEQLRKAHSQLVHVIELPTNPGYGAALNVAADSFAGDDPIAIFNADIQLLPGCLEALVRQSRSANSVVGPTLHVEATGQREAGATINHLGMPTVALPGQSPLFLPGCAMVVPRAAYETVGRFDERYFLFAEDVEFCWRALIAGFDIQVLDNAQALHVGGASASGGYPRTGERYHTTELRVALRERNSIAMMISCAPLLWLPIVLPVMVLRTLALAIASLTTGHPGLAIALIKGIAWNLRQFPSSVRRRRSLQRSSEGAREASRRLTRAPLLLRTLRRHGVPRIR